MLVFIIVAAIGLPVLLGIVLAAVSYQADKVVAETKIEIESGGAAAGINPRQTLGFEIPTNENREGQYLAARKLAAKQAAALPRGANMRIGRLGQANLQTAYDNIKNDPITATKIGTTVSWDAARLGMSAAGTAAAQQTTTTAAAGSGKVELVAGRDYEVIEITDDMAPADKRKARIANAKAKSAAYKAAKAAGQTVVTTTTAAAPAAQATAAPAASAVEDLGLEPPDLTPITDDMEAGDLRKARIANAKALSAFKKAVKQAGGDPSKVEVVDDKVVMKGDMPTPQPAAAPAPAAQPQATTAATTPADLGIDPPELTPITDDMEAGDVRKARISNAKALSAFKKAVKQAGGDPSKVEVVDGQAIIKGDEPAAQAAPTEAAAPTQPAQAAPAQAEPDNLPPKPELIEITDDMDPGDVRKARISNAKTISAYKKELKAAGIDPSTVDI